MSYRKEVSVPVRQPKGALPAESKREPGDIGNGVLSTAQMRRLRYGFLFKTLLLMAWAGVQFGWGMTVLLRWQYRLIPFIAPLLLFPPAQFLLLTVALLTVHDVSSMGVVGRSTPTAVIAAFFPHAPLVYNAAAMLAMTAYLFVLTLTQGAVSPFVRKNAIWWLVFSFNVAWTLSTPVVLFLYAKFGVWNVIRDEREKMMLLNEQNESLQRRAGLNDPSMPPASRKAVKTLAEGARPRTTPEAPGLVQASEWTGEAARSSAKPDFGGPRSRASVAIQTHGLTAGRK